MSSKARAWAIIGLVVGGVALLVVTVYVTSKDTQDKVDPLAAGLLQFVIAAASLGGSYLLGKSDAAADAGAVVRPHGRKAVRRIVNLAAGIQNFGTLVSLQRDRLRTRAVRTNGALSVDDMEAAFEVLELHVETQLHTAGDALEDWRDVVPAEVESVLREASAEPFDNRGGSEGGGLVSTEEDEF